MRVKKCAEINTFHSICYENRFGSGLYQINGVVYDYKSPELSHCYLFNKYYISDNCVYYYQETTIYPFKRYYMADLTTSQVLRLNPDSIVLTNNESIKVKDIKYESPFWFIVFN